MTPMLLTITRADVAAGHVPPRVLANGVTVPPGLQTNSMTLEAHQLYCVLMGQRRLTEEEARNMRHRPEEIAGYFRESLPAPAALAGDILPPPLPPEHAIAAHAERLAFARLRGYEGDACRDCGNFTLVRNGTCFKCDTCGSTTGCS